LTTASVQISVKTTINCKRCGGCLGPNSGSQQSILLPELNFIDEEGPSFSNWMDVNFAHDGTEILDVQEVIPVTTSASESGLSDTIRRATIPIDRVTIIATLRKHSQAIATNDTSARILGIGITTTAREAVFNGAIS